MQHICQTERLKNVFERGKKVFIPYITTGYPSPKHTLSIMKTLVQCGADILELGIPFSDPTADGPILQATSQSALEKGFSLKHYFSILQQFRESDATTPVVVFSYFNPIFRYGIESFVRKVKDSGGDALLIVDLPIEEQQEIQHIAAAFHLPIIELIALTTNHTRAKRILEVASGFVYLVSLQGVTGTKPMVKKDVELLIGNIRKITKIPLVVGFGISTSQQIKSIRSLADGLVIGSAIMKTIMDAPSSFEDELRKQGTMFAKTIHND